MARKTDYCPLCYRYANINLRAIWLIVCFQSYLYIPIQLTQFQYNIYVIFEKKMKTGNTELIGKHVDIFDVLNTNIWTIVGVWGWNGAYSYANGDQKQLASSDKDNHMASIDWHLRYLHSLLSLPRDISWSATCFFQWRLVPVRNLFLIDFVPFWARFILFSFIPILGMPWDFLIRDSCSTGSLSGRWEGSSSGITTALCSVTFLVRSFSSSSMLLASRGKSRSCISLNC